MERLRVRRIVGRLSAVIVTKGDSENAMLFQLRRSINPDTMALSTVRSIAARILHWDDEFATPLGGVQACDLEGRRVWD
jgi:hypothetical protein